MNPVPENSMLRLTPARPKFGGWKTRALLLALSGVVVLVWPTGAVAQAPSVAVSFTPASIQTGGTSRLTITLGNTNAEGAAAVLTAALTDTLPAGLSVSNPSGVGGSCTTGAVAAAAGGHSVSYGADATIPAGGCTIQVNVTGTSTTRNTYYTDTIAAGALQTNLGNNAAAASITLTVHGAAAVPKVVGMTQTAAANALQAAGFTLGTVSHSTGPSSIPYNSVLSQTPAAGAAAAAGTPVAITISTGPGLAANPNRPLTSVPGFVQPYQQSEAAALERVCAVLQSSDPSKLSAAQRNLAANCSAIIGTYGGGYDAAGFKQTLDALSGKQTTAQQRTGVQFSGAQFTNIGTRLAQLRQGASGFSASGLDLGLPMGSDLSQLFAALEDATGNRADPANARTTGLSTAGGGGGDPDSISAASRLGFFINGSLRRGSQDATTYETPFDYRANSITAGVDYRVTNQLIVGVAAGHSNGNTDFTDGSGRLDSRSNSLSLYGTFYKDAFYVDLMGTFAHIDYDAQRTTSFSVNPIAEFRRDQLRRQRLLGRHQRIDGRAATRVRHQRRLQLQRRRLYLGTRRRASITPISCERLCRERSESNRAIAGVRRRCGRILARQGRRTRVLRDQSPVRRDSPRSQSALRPRIQERSARPVGPLQRRSGCQLGRGSRQQFCGVHRPAGSKLLRLRRGTSVRSLPSASQPLSITTRSRAPINASTRSLSA